MLVAIVILMNNIIWNQYSIQEKRSAKGYFLPAIIGLYNNISKVVKHVIKRGTGSSDTKNLLDGYLWVKNFIVKIERFLMREMRKTWLATLRALAIYFIDSISTILENFNTLKNFVGMKIKWKSSLDSSTSARKFSTFISFVDLKKMLLVLSTKVIKILMKSHLSQQLNPIERSIEWFQTTVYTWLLYVIKIQTGRGVTDLPQDHTVLIWGN